MSDTRPIINAPLTMGYSSKPNSPVKEIDEIIDSLGLGSEYECHLMKEPGPRSSSTSASIEKSYTNCYPPYEEIAKLCGPGEYFFRFAYVEEIASPDSEEMERRPRKKDTPHFVLGEAWRDVYERAKQAREEQAEREEETRMRRAKMRGGSDADPSQTLNTALETLSKFQALMPRSENGMESIAKAIQSNMTMSQEMFRVMMESQRIQSQDNLKMMMFMMQNRGEATSGKGDPMSMFSTMMGMARSMIEIKREQEDDGQEEEKSPVVEKVLETVLKFAGPILQIAAKSAEERQNDPTVGIAKSYASTNPDMKAVLTDPELLKQFVNSLDPRFGAENVDAILQTFGATRPQELRENYETYSVEKLRENQGQ